MRKISKKILALFTAMVMALLAYAPAQAAMLYEAKVTLSNSKASEASAYAFSMKTKTQGDVKGIKMSWLKAPSGSVQNPTDFGPGGTSLSAISASLGDIGTWTLDKTTDAATDILYLYKTSGGSINADTLITWTINGATNPGISTAATGCNPNPTNNSAGSCFIKVTTFDTDTIQTMHDETVGNIIDQTVVGFAVTAGVTMSATVDPTLVFTVAGVNSGTDVNDAGTTTTASITSQYDTMAFGNLTVDTPKTAGHNLTVKTNANNGYSVTIRSTTDTVNANGILKGQYSGNNIDGYGLDAQWTTPQAWGHTLSTTANVDSGIVGVNSHDTDTVFTGGNANNWAPMQNANARTVMSSSGPDLGTSSVLITIAIEVNVYQPADVYTGTFQYNCTPTY